MITGFCEVDVKLFGPLHAYVTPDIVLALKLRSFPTQTGELLLAVGAIGVWFTATVTVPDELVGHPGTVTVTEYVPAAEVLTLASVGFCADAV